MCWPTKRKHCVACVGHHPKTLIIAISCQCCPDLHPAAQQHIATTSRCDCMMLWNSCQISSAINATCVDAPQWKNLLAGWHAKAAENLRRPLLHTRTFKQLKPVICTRSSGIGPGPPNLNTSGKQVRQSSPPTFQPSSLQPSSLPAFQPSGLPACEPSIQPSSLPAFQHSFQPSFQPSSLPAFQPSSLPAFQPQPSSLPASHSGPRTRVTFERIEMHQKDGLPVPKAALALPLLF